MKNKFLITLIAMAAWISGCEDQAITVDSRNNNNLSTDDSVPAADQRQQCSLPDAAITGITIDYNSFPATVITPGTKVKFTFTFETANLGLSQISLKEDIYFQAYLWRNIPSSPGGEPADGSVYLYSWEPDVLLSNGQTYTRGWATYTPKDIYEYKYLIIEVKSRNPSRFQECTLSNNFMVVYIDVPRQGDNYDPTTGCPDAVITSVDINYNLLPLTTAVKPGMSLDLKYKLTTTNTGLAALSLKKMYFVTWLSEDATFGNADDISGGGSVYLFPSEPDVELFNGQSHVDGWHHLGADLFKYKYVIIEAHTPPDSGLNECSVSNNYFIQYIDVPRLNGTNK